MTHEEWREDAICEMILTSQQVGLIIGVHYGCKGELHYEFIDKTPGPWLEAQFRAMERFFAIAVSYDLRCEHIENGWHTIQMTGRKASA